nr:MAG TPA: hypothetical protein [Caudoviricetes sp.]
MRLKARKDNRLKRLMPLELGRGTHHELKKEELRACGQ